MKKTDNYYSVGFSSTRAFTIVTLASLFSAVLLSSIVFVIFAGENAGLIDAIGSDLTKVYFFLLWLVITIVAIIFIYIFGGINLSPRKK